MTSSRRLTTLLALLSGLIVVTSLVVAQIPRPEHHVEAPPPFYPQDVLMLGVRASKFAGMALYLDSPNVLLNRADRLDLSAEQRAGLQAVIDRARREAVALLTGEQRARIEPIPTEPFVFDPLDRHIATCDTDGLCAVDPDCQH